MLTSCDVPCFACTNDCITLHSIYGQLSLWYMTKYEHLKFPQLKVTITTAFQCATKKAKVCTTKQLSLNILQWEKSRYFPYFKPEIEKSFFRILWKRWKNYEYSHCRLGIQNDRNTQILYYNLVCWFSTACIQCCCNLLICIVYLHK